MRKLKQWGMLCLVLLTTVIFVQTAGSYVALQLNRLDADAHQSELDVEEKTVKQHVLQLDAREYYTIQLGSYTDVDAGQAAVDALAKIGYRVFVSDGPPYRLWLGCMGTVPILDALPAEVRAIGSDVFVQKRILNQQNFRFSLDRSTIWQRVADWIASLDIVLKHSLQMFQDYRYEACSANNWNPMIAQIQQELVLVTSAADAMLTASEEDHAVAMLLEVMSAANRYSESLALIAELQSTQAVLLSQSCLLELIACYHAFIRQNSVNNA